MTILETVYAHPFVTTIWLLIIMVDASEIVEALRKK